MSLYNYYYNIACASDTSEPLSLADVFGGRNQGAKWYDNILVKAFMGERDAVGALCDIQPSVTMSDIENEVSVLHKPYGAQLEAVYNAMNSPISIVQGPPGTGKTEMILNLILAIHKLQPDKTVALVSSNKEAIDNIFNKVYDYREEECRLSENGENNVPNDFRDVYEHLARLGNKDRVSDLWIKDRSRGLRAAGRHPDIELNEFLCQLNKNKLNLRHLEYYKMFTCTIHSLHKVYDDSSIYQEDPDFDNRFDYVIVDECSQVSIRLGLAAMCRAREHIVLIGDTNQLAPIVGNVDEVNCKPEYSDINRVYIERPEYSFLDACSNVFDGEFVRYKAPSVLLDRHFRCHPSIAGFFNKYVYDNKLDIVTHEDNMLKMRVVWYEGDYHESVTEYKASGNSVVAARSIHNYRQIRIFIDDEFLNLVLRLKIISRQSPDRQATACVITPFRGQKQKIQTLLAEKLRAIHEMDDFNDGTAFILDFVPTRTACDDLFDCDSFRDRQHFDSENTPFRTDRELYGRSDRNIFAADDIPDEDMLLIKCACSDDLDVSPEDSNVLSGVDHGERSTIHSVQGKGYDIVYFLPVEDTGMYCPWSQKRRSINVAVSRAKKEFCIITSSQWLPPELQMRETGHVIANSGSDMPDTNDDDFYICKLLRYISDQCGVRKVEPFFGFHKAVKSSVFDKVPMYRQYLATGKNYGCELSAPARVMRDQIIELLKGTDLRAVCELPLEAVVGSGDITERAVGYDASEDLRVRKLSAMLKSAADGDDDRAASPEGFDKTDTDEEPDMELIAGELRQYVASGASFDIAVCRGEEVLLIVEVDGQYHRAAPYKKQFRNDTLKDLFIKLGGFGSVYRRVSTDDLDLPGEEGVLEAVARMREEKSFSGTYPRVSEERLKELENRMLAQYRKDHIAMRLHSVTEKCFGRVLAVSADITDADSFGALYPDYSGETAQKDFRYSSEDFCSAYICKYGMAYAFEYNLLYELILSDIAKNGRSMNGILCLGSGSAIDSLSCEYAIERLGLGTGRSHFSYLGADAVKWPVSFIDDRAGCRTEITDIISYFEKASEETHTILTFAKILNEICDSESDMSVIKKLCDKIRKVSFPLDEYYICASHGKSDAAAGRRACDMIAEAINRDGSFEVSDLIGTVAGGRLTSGTPLVCSGKRIEGVYCFSDPEGSVTPDGRILGADGNEIRIADIDPVFSLPEYDMFAEKMRRKFGDDIPARHARVSTFRHYAFSVIKLRRK